MRLLLLIFGGLLLASYGVSLASPGPLLDFIPAVISTIYNSFADITGSPLIALAVTVAFAFYGGRYLLRKVTRF